MGAERGELIIEDLTLPLALRFISGKYQGGEFPLPEDGEIVIGRSSELEMVLVEDMVSRRHAKISVEDGDIFLEDLGSTNGSFVNGEKITRTKSADLPGGRARTCMAPPSREAGTRTSSMSVSGTTYPSPRKFTKLWSPHPPAKARRYGSTGFGFLESAMSLQSK